MSILNCSQTICKIIILKKWGLLELLVLGFYKESHFHLLSIYLLRGLVEIWKLSDFVGCYLLESQVV